MWKLKPPEEQTLDEGIRAVAAAIAPAVRAKIKLPNVIGIGSGRCGTSYLFGLLVNHPEFYVTPLKEVNYFGIKQAPFTRGGWSIEDYRLCFASQKGQKFIAEISPVYLANPPAVQQIAMALQPVRIIATIRDPLDRFVSHFNYHRQFHGYDDINRYAEDGLRQFIPGYFDLRWGAPEKAVQLSLYAAGMKAAFETVGRDKVLVLVYEDLVGSEATWKAQLGEFFGTSFDNVTVPDALKNVSVRKAPAEIDDSNRSRLLQIFAEDTARLSELLGQDLTSRWRHE